jgi:hypothetical protein
MITLPLISTDTKLFHRVKTIIDSRPQDGYDLRLFTTLKSAEEFLSTAMPELLFINFSDTFQLFEAPHSDVWLQHSGIIALCEGCQTIDQINAIRGASILAALTFDDLEKRLPGILDIIRSNRPLLYHHRRGPDRSGVLAGSFRLRNNLFEAGCYINIICNYLCNSHKLTIDNRFFFHLPLYEMIANAIEHGNCGIAYEDKSRFLEHGGCAPDLIQEKCDDPAVAAKAVMLGYALHPSYGRFVIADEGAGFDWRATIDAMLKKDSLRLHGRGILITREIVRSLRYNEKGNEVTLEIDYEPPTPALRNLSKPFEKKNAG